MASSRLDGRSVTHGRPGGGALRPHRHPYPDLIWPFVGVVEIVCGALIIIGLLTRLAAIPLIIVMLVAIVSTELPIWTERGLWIFHVPKLDRYGFWSMAHEARANLTMLLGRLYLLAARVPDAEAPSQRRPFSNPEEKP